MASCKRPRRSTENYMPVAVDSKPINVDTAHTSKALNPTIRAGRSSALPSKMRELEEEIARLKLITCRIHKNLETGNNSVLQRDCEEKQSLLRQNRQLRNDLRALKINSTRQKRYYEEAIQLQVDKLNEERKLLNRTIQELEKQLQAVKDTNEELTCRINIVKEENQYLQQENVGLKKDVCAVMKTNAKFKELFESAMRMQRQRQDKETNVLINRIQDLEEELQAVMVAKDRTQKQYELQIKTHADNVNFYTRENQELRRELAALKARGSAYNLQMIGDSSEPQQDQAEKVSLASFHPIRVLGEGGFGKVLLAEKKSLDGASELYALKMLKKTHARASNVTTEKEVLILTSGHPFITTLHSCFQTKDHLFFVLEYMSGGDLKDQLRKLRVFTEKRAQFYAAEITLALQFLHKHGIVHRDLKLQNVLLAADGHCKLADFGLSSLGMFRGTRANEYCGTRCYMAPEMVQRLPYGRAVDWWGLGVVIYEMQTGEPPFWDGNRHKLKAKISNMEVSYPRWLSRQATQIISELLKKDPSQRLGSHGDVNVIRQHPYFQGIDWNALKEKRIKPPETTQTLAGTEDAHLNFKDLLNPGDAHCIINQEEFEGFSFINYGQLKAKPARPRQ